MVLYKSETGISMFVKRNFFLMLSIWGMFMNKVSLRYNFRVITLIN